MRWTGLVIGSLALLAVAQGDGALPEPSREGGMALVEALAQRRSVRAYREDRPLTRAELGQLLWAAQGTTSERGYRTAPSAGALYPLEVYVLLAEGHFHYRPDGHRLERKGTADLRGATWAAALRQEAVRRAPAVFVIAAVHARTARKYGPVRSPRYVHLEAGHAAQNLLLQAVALGLGGVPIGAFHDERLRKLLGLPDDHEPLYVIPVGKPA
jgi:SagB-type dehydrogenase family enzyme